MGLKFRLESLDGLEEPIKALYKANENGKGFILDVEGARDARDFAEFRDSAVTARKERDEALSGLKQMEDQIKEWEGKYNSLVGEKGKTNSQLEQIRQEMADAHKKTKSELEAMKMAKQEAEQELNSFRFASAFDEIAMGDKFRAKKGSIRYLRGDAQEMFEYDPSGKRFKPKETAINPDTGDLWTLDQWLNNMRNSDNGRPLFEGSQGGGAPGSGPGGTPKTFSRVDMATEKFTTEIAEGISKGTITVVD